MFAPVLLLACTMPIGDSAAPAGTLEVTVEQDGDTPVRRVRWTTPEASTGAVEFGVGGFTHQVESDEAALEHEVTVAGVGAGQEWQLRVVAEGESASWESDVVDIRADYPPTELPIPVLSIGEASAGPGYTLTPVRTGEEVRITAYGPDGRAAWWSEPQVTRGFRVRYNEENGEISWLAIDSPEEGPVFRVSTLNGEVRSIPAPTWAHHDFVHLADGRMVVLAHDSRTMEGIEVSGETIQVVSPDGSVRQAWSSWDRWTWDGTGKGGPGGKVEWPHANGLWVNEAGTTAWVSLFYPGCIVEISLIDGRENSVIGGDYSTWTVEGAGFIAQHSPVVSEDGRTLWLMDNGIGGAGAASEARAYSLDPGSHTAQETLLFDDGGAHEAILLGDVIPLDGGASFVNWGTGGTVQTIDTTLTVDWQLDFPLGAFAMLASVSPHLGATAIPER